LDGSRIAAWKAAGSLGSAMIYHRTHGCREAASRPAELQEHVIGERSVEVVGDDERPSTSTERAKAGRGGDGPQLDHRAPGADDDQMFAGLDAVELGGGILLQLPDVDGFHTAIIVGKEDRCQPDGLNSGDLPATNR